MGKEDALARQLVAKASTQAEIRDVCKRTLAEVKSLPQEKKEKAARMLAAVMASGPAFLDAAVREGCIHPLIALVKDGFEGGQIAAASALADLSDEPGERGIFHRTAIATAGGLVPLVTLLRNGSNKASMQAAAALASLSMDPGHQRPLIKAGALPPLVRLLRDGTDDAKMVRLPRARVPIDASRACQSAYSRPSLSYLAMQYAATCCANLSSGFATQDGYEESAISGHREAQDALATAGALPLLLAMLPSGKTQTAGALALTRLCAFHPPNQEQVAQLGGIPPLLSLLNGASLSSTCHAANALAELCRGNPANQNAIALAGGVGPLLSMLASRSPQAQAAAASAAAQLAMDCRDNQETVARMGGLQALVALVGAPEPSVQAMASLALAAICRSHVGNQTAVSEYGAISALSSIFRGAEDAVRAEAAGALWALAEGHSANKISIASAGGIASLVSLLADGNARAQTNAKHALAALGLDNVENMEQITALLVGMLGSGSIEAKSNAASSLWRLVQENPESRAAIAGAGEAHDVIHLLKAGSDDARAFSLWALSLSIGADNQEVVLSDGGVAPLVTMLTSSSTVSREQAAQALHRLAFGSAEAQQAIASAGGISPLIFILDRSTDQASQGAREFAGAALADLALLPENRDQIVATGGITPLVQLLVNGEDTGRRFAASALARLSKGRSDVAEGIAEVGAISPLVNLLGGDHGEEAQEEAAGALYALAESAGNRLEITEAGGIGPLVQLLGTQNMRAREHAEGALVRLSIENANRVLIIKKLVSMLFDSPFDASKEDGSGSAQEQAAAALANLARDSADNRVSIIDAGGIKPLLALLSESTQKAKENAISALTALALGSRDIQNSIAAQGGVPLVAGLMIQCCSNAKEMMASAQLCSLTADCIAQLTFGNTDNQAAMADAGVIPAIVAMLGSPHADMQSKAAGAIFGLAQGNMDIQGIVARTGAIAPLCALIKEGAEEVRDQAAGALWALATDNAPNKATIAKLGGIEPLIGLLVSGGTTPAHFDNSVGALAALSQKHTENRETIARQIVARMQSRIAMLQTPGAAVRILSSIRLLAEDHPSNQLAIGKAGGVAPLIMWLSGGFDARSFNADAQTEAAHALLALATNAPLLQEAIAKANGIPPLIELVSSERLETQNHAARCLWHLAGNGEVGSVIAEAGGVQPLVAMLSLEDTHAQELAAVVICRLSRSNPSVSLVISEAGGIAPLVGLIKHGSAAAQQQAAAALAEVALAPANRDAICSAGAVPPLVGLLSSKVIGTPETAARALARLALDTRECGDDGGAEEEEVDDDDDDDGSAAAGGDSGDDDKAQAFRRAQAASRARLRSHGTLRVTLHAGKKLKAADEPVGETDENGRGGRASSDPYVLLHAGGQMLKSTVKRMTLNPKWDEVFEFQGTLAEFLSLGKPGAKANGLALDVLDFDEVTDDDPLSQPDELGAVIVPLDALREEDPGTVEIAEAKLDTKGSLSLSISWHPIEGKPGAARRKLILGTSAVGKLITLLQATPLKAGASAKRMWDLIAGVIGLSPAAQTMDEPQQPQLEAGGGVAGALDGHRKQEQQAETIGVQEQAAATLSDFAYGDKEMQLAIMRAGGVQPLLMLLRLGSSVSQEQCTRCIWHLCASVDNQGAIVDAGAISDLVALSKTGSAKAQELAAAVISDLAKGAIVEREKVMRALAKKERQEGAGAAGGGTSLGSGAGAQSGGTGEQGGETSGPPLVVGISSSDGDATTSHADADAVDLSVDGQEDGDAAAQQDAAADRPTDFASVAIAAAKAAAATKAAAAAAEAAAAEADDESSDGAPKDRLSAIASAGGIVPLVGLVTNGAPMSKERAASALWHLSVDAVNQVAISKAGGIPPIVQLLEDGTEQATVFASDALDRLAANNPENQAMMAKRLVALLGSTSNGAQQRSANALAELARKHPGASVRIVNAGAISPLVALLGIGAVEAKEAAVGALSTLAANDQSNQLAIATGLVALLGQGTAEAQEHVTHMLIKFAQQSAENRSAIAEAGAVPRLVMQLKSSGTGTAGAPMGGTHGGGHGVAPGGVAPGSLSASSSSMKAQELAAAVLSYLSADGGKNIERIMSAGGVRPLIALLSASESPQAQSSASAVLSDMTRTSRAIQMAVAKENAIEPLVALLATDNALEARSAAAGAVWSLAKDNPDTQTALAEAIPPLVRLLDEADAEAQRKAAGALASLAIGSEANQNAAVTAGGIGALVTLLGEGSSTAVHAEAASALAEIARGHAANQSAIAAAEGIVPLVRILEGAGDEAAKQEAASALWSLSSEHRANQEAIAAASGIAPLVKLCGDGGDHAQLQAAGALASVGLDHEINTEAISRMLVGLIGTQNAKPGERWRLAGSFTIKKAAVSLDGTTMAKAARAIARLARSHASFQVALASAGCVAPLVKLLSTPPPSGASLASLTASLKRQGSGAMTPASGSPPASPPKDATPTSPPKEKAEFGSPSSEVGEQTSEGVVRGSAGEGGAATATPEKTAGGGAGVTSPAGGGGKLVQRGQHLGSLHTEASAALWALASHNSANQISIAEAGAVPLLIGLLGVPSSELHRDAAGALWSLADGQQANQSLIASSGGIVPLIGLLAEPPSQDTSAGALHSLAALEANRVAIADAGGVGALVNIFQSGNDAAKSEAAGALATLAMGNEKNQHAVAQSAVKMLVKAPPLSPCALDVCRLLHELALSSENRNALSKAGAIPQLALHLRDGTASGQTMAANALSKIALKSAQHRLQVTQQLITLLGSDVEAVRQRAGTALKAMSAEGDHGGQHLTVAMAGGIDRFVSLLKDGSVEAQEYTLSLLWQSTDTASKRSMATANCSRHVIAIMENASRVSSLAQEHASALLARLLTTLPGEDGEQLRSTNATEIVAHGGIPPLAALLRGGTPGAKRFSSQALAQLSLALETSERGRYVHLSAAEPNAAAQRQTAEAGAVSHLIEWLRDETVGPPERAAQALACLAQGNPDIQMAIAEEGAIAPLVALMDLSREPAKGAEAIETAHKAQRWAAAAIAALAEDSSANQVAVAEEGGIAALVELLKRVGVSAPHENATKALWHLAAFADNKISIAKAGGIRPLVRLLVQGSEQAAEWAAAALEELSNGCADNQLSLLRDGAIPPLIELLGSDSDQTQRHSLGALLHISAPGEANLNAVVTPLVGLLEVRNADAQLKAAELLALLAARSGANCDAIFSAGAIPKLVRLLGDGRMPSSSQVRAADALSFLSRHGAHRAAIIESAGVPPLVQMLKSANAEAQARSSAALVHIASATVAQPMITGAGGIPLLVQLLSSERVDCQRHAAGALWHLEGARGENKAELVRCGGIMPLVRVLSRTDCPEAQESAAGVLADLAKEHEKAGIGMGTGSSKRAMVNLGAISGLVALLANAGATPGAQRHAACALWGISLEARYQSEVVAQGAVDSLVEQLRHTGEAQGYSLAALTNLVVNGDARAALLAAGGLEPLVAIAIEHGSGNPHVGGAQGGAQGGPGEHSKTWLGAQAKDLLFAMESSGDGGSAVDKALAELRSRAGHGHVAGAGGAKDDDKKGKKAKTRRSPSPRKKEGKGEASGAGGKSSRETGNAASRQASHRSGSGGGKASGKPPLSSRGELKRTNSSTNLDAKRSQGGGGGAAAAPAPAAGAPRTASPRTASPRPAPPKASPSPRDKEKPAKAAPKGTPTKAQPKGLPEERAKSANKNVRFTAKSLFPDKEVSA